MTVKNRVKNRQDLARKISRLSLFNKRPTTRPNPNPKANANANPNPIYNPNPTLAITRNLKVVAAESSATIDERACTANIAKVVKYVANRVKERKKMSMTVNNITVNNRQ